MAKLINAIWLHRFQDVHETTVEEILRWWDRDLYVHAISGTNYENRWDHDPLAVINGDGGREWAWRGYQGPWDDSWTQTNWIPWTVPQGVAPITEATMTRELNSDSLILDLEPYAAEGFWMAGPREMAMFLDHMNGRPFDVTLDYRRLYSFPPHWMLQAAGRIIPQCYWTDFRRPPVETLQAAWAVVGEQYPGSIEMALPANGDGDDVRQALDWCAERNLRVSFWVWQSFNSGSWQALEDYRDVEIDA